MNPLRCIVSAVFLSLLLVSLSGCSCSEKPRREPAGKNAVADGTRRKSEFDFYCAMRPPSSRDTPAGKTTVAFTTVVFDRMKAEGYKVYLVRYGSRTTAARTPAGRVKVAGYGLRDFFGEATAASPSPVQVAYQSGYGMRDFWGDRAQPGEPSSGAGANESPLMTHPVHSASAKPRPGARSSAGTTPDWNREVVVWETRRGEFFLVDGPYASPRWVKGQSWLERVRFCDPAAAAVAEVRS